MRKLLIFILWGIASAFLTQTTLQELIDATPAGGTLTLPDGATYTGNFTIQRSITIEGKAKIITPNADPALWIVPNTRDVTLRGVDISASGFVYDIVRIGTWGPAQDTLDKVPTNITLDGVAIHGDSLSDSQRGIAANGANVRITNSRIYEIHTRGADSQAICAWNGPGPYLIADNYLEAAGENLMFGGADPSIAGLVPSDVQILRNHFFKPLSWKVGDPSYAGIHWSVKNLLEIKMGRNITIDSNVLENCWGDAQIGYAVLLTVRNQDGGAPWATIENVKFTNNLVRNSEQGIQLIGMDSPNVSQQGSNLTIQNNQFDSIQNWWLVISGFNSVTVEHNTHLQGGNLIVATGRQSLGFIYRNNATLRSPTSFGIKGDGTEEGIATLNAYFLSWVVEGNLIAGAWEKIYPINNFYPADLSNLPSYKGTDGLVPGYIAPPISPTPTPTPQPVPSPTPSPSPTPVPLPTPISPAIGSRVTVTWETTETRQDQQAAAQRTQGYYFYRNLAGKKAEFVYTGVKLP